MELEAANQIIRTVSRALSSEFPLLSVMFITHEPGACEKAMEKKSFDIEHHMAGGVLLPRLQEQARQRDVDLSLQQDFAGIAIEKDKKLLSFMEKDHALACFFIDVSRFEDEYQVRHHALGLIYQVLKLVNPPHGKLSHLRKKHNGFYRPETGADDIIENHIMGDSFAAIYTRIEGQKNALIKMAKFRTLQALTPKARHAPELYPSPLVYDLGKLVLKEQEGKIERDADMGNLIFQTAYELTQDVREAFDIKSVGSWKNFCEAAQQMAWAEIEPRKILGTAIYSCEDPFIRSDAYLVSDILGMEPLLITNFDFYNPFTDDEVNERRHQKLCMDVFDSLVMNFGRVTAHKFFLKKAQEQNDQFFKGKLLGWCAPALIEIAAILEDETQEHNPDQTKDLFVKAVHELSWETIKSAGIEIINHRRSGIEITSMDQLILSEPHPEWDPIRAAMVLKHESHL